MNLLQALLGTVLPVFLLAGLGYIARVKLKVGVRDPSRLAVYLMTPGLIMNSILTSKLNLGEVGKILGFGLLLCGIMIFLTLTFGRLLGWSSRERSAAVLITSFMNAANYGLPVVLLAFGQAGFERAAIFVVLQSLLMYSVAVFFAARGRMNWRESVAAVFRLPLLWAALVAMTIRVLGIGVPDFIMKPIGLLANGAVVVVIILLGMQVASIEVKGAWAKIVVTSTMRLALSPLIGLALIWWLKPDPLTARVLVLESAMPAAVNTTLLASEFGTEPDMVSAVALVTTVCSMVTVTFWVWYLQNYFT